MTKRINDIQDDEIRVIGGAPSRPGKKRLSWLWMLLAALVCVILIIIAILLGKPEKHESEENLDFFDPSPEVVDAESPQPEFLGTASITSASAFTEIIDTTINDVPLILYIPHNTIPILTLGAPDEKTRQAVLAFQAADIRKDNRKILGAFVLKGEPLAWGLSKKGYCAIIDGKVTVGVSENSPLFEEATEKEGYFFRQYPLVDNGSLVENEPKNKTMRKALCDRKGQIFVAVSANDESLHDFAQALVDLGVDNAIYLVGSHSAFGWYRNEAGERTYFSTDTHRASFKNESYIVWP